MSLRLRNPLTMLRSNTIALDIGSAQTVIASPDGRILLDEPTVIALEQYDDTVIVTGVQAKGYLGKTPDRIRVVKPLEAGAIVHFNAAKLLLRNLLSQVFVNDGKRIKVCVVTPHGLTELEKRTILDCCKAVGIAKADMVSAPLAAAVAAGLDITQPKGRLLLGIGAGVTEATMVSLSDIVHSETIPCGGNAFHAAVARHLAATRQVAIGENMAEQATLGLASAAPSSETRAATLTGKNVTTGSPCSLELLHQDLDGALDQPLAEIEALVRSVMERAPAELVADIGETGLVLYGGAARLPGLTSRLSQRLGLRVARAEEPQYAAVQGAAAALRPDLGFRKILLRK
ncbi:rod shape-determining protein MreB [Humidesulfovibrio mexicanus]|uniref:Rod shape-determining protein MreB n=1 Tax=Humidesulfovibrio mexicanus TaxID=147047 RepID=A0A238XKE1_9BACT|nr:rod shape-determining protein [Humidesulfovibrio mexicanus]SNR59142.1 rod shape-determining protein MreB [Humidesulfovibrio mexicanus]